MSNELDFSKVDEFLEKAGFVPGGPAAGQAGAGAFPQTSAPPGPAPAASPAPPASPGGGAAPPSPPPGGGAIPLKMLEQAAMPAGEMGMAGEDAPDEGGEDKLLVPLSVMKKLLENYEDGDDEGDGDESESSDSGSDTSSGDEDLKKQVQELQDVVQQLGGAAGGGPLGGAPAGGGPAAGAAQPMSLPTEAANQQEKSTMQMLQELGEE